MTLIIELLAHLTPYGHYAYLLMFAILLACGFGFPMPEDVILVTGGILASRAVTDFGLTLAVCMAGVIIGDGIVFSIGRYAGPRIKESRLYARIMPSHREAKVMSWFGRHGEKVIFFARFAPGLRMPLFLTAGIYQVSPWKFLALDGFAALISVPLWIYAGFVFGSNLEVLEAKIKQLQGGTYGALALVLVAIACYFAVKKHFKTKASDAM